MLLRPLLLGGGWIIGSKFYSAIQIGENVFVPIGTSGGGGGLPLSALISSNGDSLSIELNDPTTSNGVTITITKITPQDGTFTATFSST